MHEAGWMSFGNHLFRIDGDLLTLRPRGVIMLEDMQRMHDLQADVRKANGTLFVLYDSRENTGLDHAARKYATDHTPAEARIDAAASFGAPYTMRVFVNMMQRAAKALGRGPMTLQMFDTEVEARTHLEQERNRLRAK